jgi:uncharacterized protein YjbI with pentapeptide repeats
MSPKLAQTEGALFAYLLSSNRLAVWLFGLAGVILLGLALYFWITSAFDQSVIALTSAGVMFCLTQAMARGTWTFVVPNVAVVLAAGALGYASLQLGSGQTLLSADEARKVTPKRIEGTDEPAYVTSGEVELAWIRIEEGRVNYDAEPEREAIGVLLKAGESFEGRDFSFLTLSNLELRGAPQAEDLSDKEGLDLSGVQFYGARMQCTDFGSAKLTSALFDFPNGLKEGFGSEGLRTNARYASFKHAKLDDSRLGNVDFTLANFENAEFGAADLTGATLDFANLAGASLERTKGLTPEQISKACIGAQTQLPPHIVLAGDIQWSEQCRVAWGAADPRAQAASQFAMTPEGIRPYCVDPAPK